MRKNVWRKLIGPLFAVVTVWISVIVFSVVTLATVNGTLPDGLIHSNESGTWTVSKEYIECEVETTKVTSGCSTSYTSGTAQITITNTSGEDRTLVLDGAVTPTGNGGTVSVNGQSYTGGEVTLELAAGDEFTISLTSSDSGDASVKLHLDIKNFSSGGNVSIEFTPVSGVEYSANGTTVSANAVTLEESTTNGFTIAPITSKYHFIEAVVEYSDGTTARLKSDASGKVYPTKDGVITPVFAYDANDIAPFLANGATYWTWETAFAAIGSSGTVILNDNYTLPAGNYTIPSGITLLIPYDSANTLCTTKPTIDGTTGFLTATAEDWVKPTAYRTLTMANGASITINGAMSLSGKMCVKQRFNGCPTGPLGFVSMTSGSTITVNNGGILYVWGYITGAGSVTVKSGGTVYENFQLKDWRGGSAASDMLGKSQRVFPSSQYYVQNVEVPMTLEAGAFEYAYMGLIASRTFGDTTVPFIGSSGMFRLSNGSLTKDYIEETDRLQVDINGDMSMSALVLSVSSYDMDSSDYVLPISNSLTVNINRGTTTMSQDMALLPGTEIVVGKGATLAVSSGVSLFMYDLDEWNAKSYVYPARDYTPLGYVAAKNGAPVARTLADAKIKVLGTLDMGTAYLYSTNGGANICGDEGGIIKIGAIGTATDTYQATQSDTDITFVSIPVITAKLQNGNGADPITIVVGTYHYAHGLWHKTDTAPVVGDPVTTAPTCTQQGYTSQSCSICGEGQKYNYVPALGHNYGSATYSWTGVTSCTATHTCTRCGDVKTLNATITNAVTKAATCTATGVRTYTAKFAESWAATQTKTETIAINASAHSWNAGTVTKAATCTTDGVMTYTCQHNSAHTKTETIAKVDHKYSTYTSNNDATCTADGTKTASCDYGCGTKDTVTDTGSKTAHNYKTVVTQPTCTTDGYTTYTCSGCNDTYTADTVTATGHTTVVDAAVAATCTEPGKTEGSHCSTCGTVFTAQEDIQALGHEAVVDAAVEATCTESGLTAGSHCSTCGETIVAQNVVSALGHDFNDWTTVTEATCTEDGSQTHSCSVCGTAETQTIKAQGHQDRSMVTAALCWNECATCGEKSDQAAREYNIILKHYNGQESTISGCAHGSTDFYDALAGYVNTNSSACYTLDFVGWQYESAAAFWATVTDESVTPETTDLVIEGNYTPTGFRSDSIWASVEYSTDANNQNVLHVTVFITTDANVAQTILVKNGEADVNSSDPVVSDTQIVTSYAIDYTSDDIIKGGYVTITVGGLSKQINNVLFAYADALKDADVVEDNDNITDDTHLEAQQTVVDAIMSYGGAVQEYFHGDKTHTSTTVFPTISSENLTTYGTVAPEFIAADTAESVVTASFYGTQVRFNTTLTLRYFYEVAVTNGTISRVGVIISDSEIATTQGTAWTDTADAKLHWSYGKNGDYYMSSSDEMSVNQIGDKYATIYVEYKDENGKTCYAYGDTMIYGIVRYLQKQIYQYSPNGAGKLVAAKNGETVEQQTQRTMEYVNLLNSMIEAHEAMNALATTQAQIAEQATN